MQIASIQLLRAFAAMLVAFGHAQAFIAVPMSRVGQSFSWSYFLPWGAGVDLFFIISGFIMVYASEKLFCAPNGSRIFMRRRIARIVPLYWIIAAFSLIINALRDKPGHDPIAILASFLFIPWASAGAEVPRPVYELGWTLNYEMFFYAIFALTLGFRREVAVALTIAILGTLTLFGVLFPQTQPQLFVWTQPIILEFALGALLALMMRAGLRLPAFVRFAFIAAGLGLLYCDFLHLSAHPYDWVTPNDFSRVCAWGLPSALLFIGFVFKSSRESNPNPLTRFGVHLGDASYALYLCHPIIFGAFSLVWFKLGLNFHLSPWIGIFASVAAATATSLAIHRWFEAPLTAWLQRKPRAAIPDIMPVRADGGARGA